MSEKYSNAQFNSTIVRTNYFVRIVSNIIMSVLYPFASKRVEYFIRNHFFVPKHYPLTSEEIELLNTAEKFELVVDKKPFKCWRWGEGPFIVFSHGWNGHGSQFIFFIEHIIKQGYSVITFDGPAHGQSAGHTSSYFQMTDAVRSIINYFGQTNIAGLIGHSFGASAIVNAVYNEKIDSKLVLLAPALDLKNILENTFTYYGVPIKIFRDIILKYEQKYNYSLHYHNPVNILKRLDQKLLIIHDENDAITPHSESKIAAEESDNIKLFSTKGLGHKKILIDPQVIEKTTVYFNN